MIPPMTDPHGRYWNQPDRAAILLDDTHALMTQATFKALPDYSGSLPSGVYDGKMWKRGEPYVGPTTWLLCWYGPTTDPDKCSVNWRRILIV